MFRTKQDVDRHAANILGRIKNEKEKSSRGYQIARLYSDVGEHEIAKRYLSSFLGVRETVPQAHKLMGHIFMKTGDKEKAMECYKRSLELDGSQKDLIIKICELCSQVNIDPERARFWLEKAESSCPGNDVIFRLREKIAQSAGNEDFVELEKLLTSELAVSEHCYVCHPTVMCVTMKDDTEHIAQRPGDVTLHIKLLQLYLKSGKLEEAYNIAIKTDRNMAFTESLEWYEALLDTYYAYKAERGCRGDTAFFVQFLHTLRAVVYLRLSFREPVACAEILHQFDLVLQEASQIPKPQDEWVSFLNEMYGQFYFLCAALLLKRAQKGTIAWKDVVPLAAVCFLLSNLVTLIDSRSEWFVLAGKEKKRFFDYLLMISNFRKCQAGHTLHALGKGDTATWCQKLRQQHCNTQGKGKLFDLLFTQPHMRTKKDQSYLMKSRTFEDSPLLFLTRAQLKSFDIGCHQLHPQNLTDLIWIALQRYSCKDKSQPHYGFDVFGTLQLSTKNISNGGAESLCQLDTNVFLYASVRCAALKRQEMISMGHTDPAQPDFLPLCLSKCLCTQEQADWWLAAYKFITNAVRENFSKMRHLLQRGIETVRLLGSHGMSVSLVIHVARCLEVKAKALRELGPEFCPRADDTDLRAVYYWENAVEMLDRMQKNKVPPVPKHRLFSDNTDADLDEMSMKLLMAEAQYAVGYAAMKEKKFEESIRIFEKLENPRAAFNTAKIYMTLADQERSRDAPVGREQHQILLTKARDAIFLTMDLLQGNKKHELNKSVEQLLDDVESQLQCISDWDEEEEEPSQYLTPSTSRNEGDSTLDRSTPKEKGKSPGRVSFNTSAERSSHRVRPSPERLDAQVRSLAHSHESLVKLVLARNEELVKINSQMVEALRENREYMSHLEAQLNVSQKINLSGLSTTGSHIPSSPYQPQYPAPQGLPHPQYGYQMTNPAAMAAYRPQSPCPRSRTNLMTHHGFIPKQEEIPDGEDDEENPCYIDGEYFEESLATQGQYFVPDSQLIQDWPYGHRTGIEGNSTVTYAPQNRPQIPQSGYFASSLRGQALQYGGHVNPLHTSMPGPGYFSSPQSMAASVMTQTPSLVAAIIGKDQPPKMGQIPGHMGMQRLPGQQPLQSATAGIAIGQKQSYNPGQFDAGVNTASTPLAKATTSLPMVPSHQGMVLGQNAGAQNVAKTMQATVPPSLVTPEGVCLFQGKASYTSKLGTKQDGNVMVLFMGPEKKGRVRMDTMTTNQAILNHDIKTLKLCTSFTPQLVTWKRPQPDGKGEETVNITFGCVEMAQKMKSVIQAIQDATRKASESSPKTPAQTASPFNISSGTPAFKTSATSSIPVPAQAQSSPAISEDKKEQAKTQFGGFTFTTAPSIKPVEDKSKTSPTVKLKESVLTVTSPGATDGTLTSTQAKPFAGFTFTPTKPSPQTSPATTGGKGSGDFTVSSTSNSSFILGQNSPMLSFSNLAAKAGSGSFGNSGATAFANTGQTPFQGSPSKGREDEERVDEYEPNIDFKPIIDLPDLVEIKTGEEEEEKVFGERARLFRFDDDTKQWKERGIGEMKILHNKSTDRYRILMRREQVLKICANHAITKEMRLTPMSSSDRAWCWTTVDFAEEEMTNEKFAIKFKTSELAQKFKDSFESCQEAMTAAPVNPVPESVGSVEVKAKQEQKSLSDIFKPKEGSWNCPGCYCVNDKDKLKCPACNTTKPGSEGEKQTGATKPAPFSGFTLPQGMKFGDSSAKPASGFSFGSLTDSGGFSFGSKPPTTGVAASKLTSQPETVTSTTTEDKPDASKDTSKAEVKEGSKVKSLAEMFKPKEGSWDCPGCYCRNEASHSKCPACQTQKPGTKPEAQKSDSLSFGAFSMSSGMGFSTKPSSTTTPSKDQKKTDFKTGSLLAEMLQSTESQVDPKTTSGFSFTPKSSGFVFGDAGKKDTTGGFNFWKAADTPKSGTGGFQFNLGTVSTPLKTKAGEKPEGDSPFQFTFSLTPAKSPQAKATPASPRSPEGDYYVNKEEDDSHIYFEPIVSLPEKVDLKTGEEQEMTRFEHRAKLFRFSDGEWKERGLGVMKILEHTETHKCRLLMRREQIHKICCNHSITPELDLKAMQKADGKAWVWYAQDFSEEEPKVEQFAIKFKTKEIADEFKKEFDSSRTGKESKAATSETSSKAAVGATIVQEEVLGKSTHEITGDKGNRYYSTTGVEDTIQSTCHEKTGDEGNVYYGSELQKAGTAEPSVSSSVIQGTGQQGNPMYTKELHEFVEEPSLTSSVHQTTGEKGNSFYSTSVSESMVSSKVIQGTGQDGNPMYSKELDKLVQEPVLTSSSHQTTGDRGNPYSSTSISEQMVSSKVIQGTGQDGNLMYSRELDKLVQEPVLTSSSHQTTGDKGNPYYSSMGETSISEQMVSSKVIQGTGKDGNPMYSRELDKLVQEPSLTSSSHQTTGDKGNPYYSSMGETSISEQMVSSKVIQGTGQDGNPMYSRELDKLVQEPVLTSSSHQTTGDKGNPYYSSMGETSISEQMVSSKVIQGTGKDGNPMYSRELDKLVQEPVLTSSSHQTTGDKGNPYHKPMMDNLVVEPVMVSAVAEKSGDTGNPLYSCELTKHRDSQMSNTPYTGEPGSTSSFLSSLGSVAEDPSDVEFLYVEEATEEQKEMARKYLLPESFYLYEKKPDCPGCRGCEDFDAKTTATASKPKPKGNLEPSTPSVSSASVQSSDSATGDAASSGLFGSTTGPSFSTLAAQGDSAGYSFKKDDSKPFHWSGAGQQLFGGGSPGGKGEEDGSEVVASDDIEFKPIIDLPDLVEVKTGEEGWDVVYSQRSKLYRFVKEVNQWKERATGEMKILKQEDRYRLLMRRDQVHKVACNHLVTPSVKLEPLQTSETAWCWTAQDYSEGEPKVEQFALRFKTEELARQFRVKFEECQKLVGQGDVNTNNSSASRPSDPSEDQQQQQQEEEEEESGQESDEDSVTIFDKRATLSCFEDNQWMKLGMGDLRIVYNEDLNGNSISMSTDSGQKICNHVICREHTVSLEKKQKACLWTAKDFTTDEPIQRYFKAQFGSLLTAEEFYKSFFEGVSLARDSDISEITTQEMETPVVFSRGDATSLKGVSGPSERSQSADTSQKGSRTTPVLTCSPELTDLLNEVLQEGEKS